MSTVDTTPTGIPVSHCIECDRVHPVTRKHCTECRSPSIFNGPDGRCLKHTEDVAP